MHKIIFQWSVKTLSEQFQQIEFPDYQREPNIWALSEKRRLIDSMIREFDIASLYFYQHENDVLDCVDGRQRIGTIMAFLGINPDDADNKFCTSPIPMNFPTMNTRPELRISIAKLSMK